MKNIDFRRLEAAKFENHSAKCRHNWAPLQNLAQVYRHIDLNMTNGLQNMLRVALII